MECQTHSGGKAEDGLAVVRFRALPVLSEPGTVVTGFFFAALPPSGVG